MQTTGKNYFKFFATLVLCLLVRLIPFRAPNIEPIMAGTMPIGRAYGAFFGFSFAVLSILIYDFATHTIGMQTIFTATAYGLIGLYSSLYFKKRKGKITDYMLFAVYGTLFFDAVTGLTVGPIFFHQSFVGSLVGQIPFTALHLLGNVTLAACLSPGIYHFLIRKRKKESVSTINTLNPKII
ncbi:hypothetical protein HY311_01890 [Candidatus Nomurabacteria bacterium]|nr:hypothetical protein [Candidatus Nomurabacteria bacterium]